ncbi:anti-phage ZorAB system protein ZorA [Vibrio tapetis]|uniref:Uncharacterized protein n=1 Tax=Vibrio tapetis subsp. tapetis TaxID=1671868 RepID=A0A2N8ZKW1_9VIBR|nr:anti-phage ZorAB system protein ZorA [Vibrio tapetis]SON52545.1 conserved protein of unknown function [Vibrio tapetis subsp. tapetis]
MDKLVWLLPDFMAFSSLSFESQLSTIFVGVLLAITFLFLFKSFYSGAKAWKRINWLKDTLTAIRAEDIASKREYLYSLAKEKKDSVGHLWLEFDETLIEERKDNKTTLYNTFDAAYFFNTTTLAKGVTENRLIAAVPGFLTAIGVIGTFVGLQIGLSEMNISADVSVDEMKSGVAAVIGGAKVAFMTSVWGVFLSVVFNFIEKLLEQAIRRKVNDLQKTIDEIFPRLSAESQLQTIAESNVESRDSLQGLAEQIGVKMQESMMTATRGISEALESSLNEIMAPAINKLVEDTSEGNQKALEELLTKFMDGFGAQGQQQRLAMEGASEQVNESIADMNRTMESFINKMEFSQQQSGERERDLMSSISVQVGQLVDQSNLQVTQMNELMSSQLANLNKNFESGQHNAAEREKQLISAISSQISQLVTQNSKQVSKTTELMGSQLESLNNSFDEGKKSAAQREEKLIEAMSTQVTHLVNQGHEQAEKMNNLMGSQLTHLSNSFDESKKSADLREEKLIESISAQVTYLVNQGQAQSAKMNELVESQLSSINDGFEARQASAAQREEKLTSNIEQQIESLTSGISAQSNVLTEFVNNQMTNLQKSFEDRDQKSVQIAEQRNQALAQQTSSISNTTQELVKQIDVSMKNQQTSSEQIIQQGKALQQSVESTMLANAKATDCMRESASELKSAADSMNVFGSHVRDAGNKLSGAVTAAVESTKDLAQQNQSSAKMMETLRDNIVTEVNKFSDVTDSMNGMVLNAGNTFTELKSSQSDYLHQLKGNVIELSKQMTELLSEYSTQANAQTTNHLKIWAESSTQYAESMNNAARALSGVVDEIQDKVGA